MLAMGANPWVLDKGGNSAILMAAYYSRRDMVRRLISLHGDNNVNVLGSIGYAPIGVAAMRGDAEILKMLIDAGAKPDVHDYGGGTPLLNAIRFNRDQNLAILLSGGADPDLADDLGVTPLMAAAQIGRLDYVDMLLKNKAYPSARDTDGSTALYYAIFFGFGDVAKHLIKSGAVVYGLNNGYTVLHWARVMGMKDVVALLESPGAVN
jgi:ankyrin repeat protein